MGKLTQKQIEEILHKKGETVFELDEMIWVARNEQKEWKEFEGKCVTRQNEIINKIK